MHEEYESRKISRSRQGHTGSKRKGSKRTNSGLHEEEGRAYMENIVSDEQYILCYKRHVVLQHEVRTVIHSIGGNHSQELMSSLKSLKGSRERMPASIEDRTGIVPIVPCLGRK